MDSRNVQRVHRIDDMSSDTGSVMKNKMPTDVMSQGSYMRKVIVDDATSQGTVFEKPGANRLDETMMSHGSYMVKVDDTSSQGTTFFMAGNRDKT